MFFSIFFFRGKDSVALGRYQEKTQMCQNALDALPDVGTFQREGSGH
jgi:hypothetical protein